MDTVDPVSLFRAVGFAEYDSILDTRKFSLRPNGLESKYFGMNFNETLDFANKVFNIHVVAIVEAKVEREVLNQIGDFTKVDITVFKSGTVEIHKEHLERFNRAVSKIKHVY